jgi:hypothetical protein
MAHFAKLDENNVVLEVHVVNNDVLDPENEEASGIAFLTELFGEDTNWKQTSYNTAGGTHFGDKPPLRKNYAGIGMIYDPEKDMFHEPQPFPSWILDEETAYWNPPVPQPSPEEGYSYWDESTVSWKFK